MVEDFQVAAGGREVISGRESCKPCFGGETCDDYEVGWSRTILRNVDLAALGEYIFVTVLSWVLPCIYAYSDPRGHKHAKAFRYRSILTTKDAKYNVKQQQCFVPSAQSSPVYLSKSQFAPFLALQHLTTHFQRTQTVSWQLKAA